MTQDNDGFMLKHIPESVTDIWGDETIEHVFSGVVGDEARLFISKREGRVPCEFTVAVTHEEGGRRRLQVIALPFQKGPYPEAGVNGLTNELMLVTVLARLRAFQEGNTACRENALAITKIEEALHWLFARTRDRLRRGVEGRHEA